MDTGSRERCFDAALCGFSPGNFYKIPAMGAIKSTVQVMSTISCRLIISFIAWNSFMHLEIMQRLI